MKAQVVKGSKQQIAETVVRIDGEVREAIVFVEEPSDQTQVPSGEDIFAEMEPLMVKVGGRITRVRRSTRGWTGNDPG